MTIKHGDLILQPIATVIQDNIRASDIPCRYGGEEFRIIYTDISLENTIRLVDKLRKDISLIDVHHNQMAVGQVTVSLGLPMIPEHADNTVELFSFKIQG
ncbi:MAG: diguanylate cyclase [Porticoccaceae bacterium]|nr:diguanylate cyclase [Porticoccaceae bacterium]